VNYLGPAYVRLARDKTEVLYTAENVPNPYEIHCLTPQQEGKASFLATGHMLGYALKAAEFMNKAGFPVAVYDVTSLKPLDEKALREIGGKGPLVTIEDHNVINGLGAAVAEYTFCPLQHRIGVKDKFGQTGKPEELFSEYNMAVRDIYECMRTILRQERIFQAPVFENLHII
jgi:transketolase